MAELSGRRARDIPDNERRDMVVQTMTLADEKDWSETRAWRRVCADHNVRLGDSTLSYWRERYRNWLEAQGFGDMLRLAERRAVAILNHWYLLAKGHGFQEAWRLACRNLWHDKPISALDRWLGFRSVQLEIARLKRKGNEP